MQTLHPAAPNSLRRVLVPAAALCALLAGATDAHAATLAVDRDKAQCPNAPYQSIQHAVDAARPGDTVKVCADHYSEQVTVDKPLTVHGETPADEAAEAEIGATAGGDCFEPIAVDPTVQAIVDPGDGNFSVAFTLRADDVVLHGFVVQGASVGIDTSDSFSGYRIRDNLIQNNSLFGVDFGSAGARESRFDHNCVRHNRYGLVSELDDDSVWPGTFEQRQASRRDLRNARIDHNDTFENGAGIDAAGPGERVDVTIDHNRSLRDGSGILLQNSRRSAIVENEVAGATAVGGISSILIGGANTDLVIASNIVTDGQIGIQFFGEFAGWFDDFLAPSERVVVVANTVQRMTFSGINLRAASRAFVRDSIVAGNVSSDNGADGILVAAGNTGTAIRHNLTERNRRYGLRGANSAGNTFHANRSFDNGVFDARDDIPGANVWTSNQCITDSPDGICGP